MIKNISTPKWALLVCTVFLVIILAGCGIAGSLIPEDTSRPDLPVAAGNESSLPGQDDDTDLVQVEKGQPYNGKDQVAAYIHEFGELPPNFYTKSEAQQLGWDNSRGNLWEVTDQGSIGGDRFGNREGLLPKAQGRQYYECDINYGGGYRGAERLVFSNDGLIFYSDDHYNSFDRLY